MRFSMYANIIKNNNKYFLAHKKVKSDPRVLESSQKLCNIYFYNDIKWGAFPSEFRLTR